MNRACRLGEMTTRGPVRVLLTHEIGRGCLSHVIGCNAKDLDEEMAQFGARSDRLVDWRHYDDPVLNHRWRISQQLDRPVVPWRKRASRQNLNRRPGLVADRWNNAY